MTLLHKKSKLYQPLVYIFVRRYGQKQLSKQSICEPIVVNSCKAISSLKAAIKFILIWAWEQQTKN